MSSAIIDLSTLADVHVSMQLGLCDRAPVVVDDYENKLRNGDKDIRNISLTRFCTIISFDTLWCDRRALTSYPEGRRVFEVAKKLGGENGVIQYKYFDIDFYRDAMNDVARLRTLATHGAKLPERLASLLSDLFNKRLEQRLHDESLFRMFGRDERASTAPYKHDEDLYSFDDQIPSQFGNTNNSIERMLTYLEVARSLKMPVVLNTRKYEALDSLSGYLLP